MTWDVEALLNHIQELLGEPVGAFYNISTRLSQLNMAQRTLVEETRALSSTATLSLTTSTNEYSVPVDFLTFDAQAPYLIEAGDTTPIPVKVTTPSILDKTSPGWQDTTQTGRPTKIIRRGSTLTVVPTPDASYTLYLPYTVEPDELTDMTDVPFNGDLSLNRFAPLLAYAVARTHMIARAPQLAEMFEAMYTREERKMRHFVRSNPQHHQTILPPTYRR